MLAAFDVRAVLGSAGTDVFLAALVCTLGCDSAGDFFAALVGLGDLATGGADFFVPRTGLGDFSTAATDFFVPRVGLGDFSTTTTDFFAPLVGLGDFSIGTTDFFVPLVGLGDFSTGATDFFVPLVGLGDLTTGVADFFVAFEGFGDSATAVARLGLELLTGEGLGSGVTAFTRAVLVAFTGVAFADFGVTLDAALPRVTLPRGAGLCTGVISFVVEAFDFTAFVGLTGVGALVDFLALSLGALSVLLELLDVLFTVTSSLTGTVSVFRPRLVLTGVTDGVAVFLRAGSFFARLAGVGSAVTGARALFLAFAGTGDGAGEAILARVLVAFGVTLTGVTALPRLLAFLGISTAGAGAAARVFFTTGLAAFTGLCTALARVRLAFGETVVDGVFPVSVVLACLPFLAGTGLSGADAFRFPRLGLFAGTAFRVPLVTAGLNCTWASFRDLASSLTVVVTVGDWVGVSKRSPTPVTLV